MMMMIMLVTDFMVSQQTLATLKDMNFCSPIKTTMAPLFSLTPTRFKVLN